MVQANTGAELIATAEYQPEPEAAACARRFVRDTLRSWQPAGPAAQPGPGGPDDLVSDAVLLTSELVTNAVRHAGTPVQVTCRLAADMVEVTVLDRSPAQPIPDPHGVPAAAGRTCGRGLQLPFALASAWGVTYARAAKAVWFRMGRSGPGAPDAGRAGAPDAGQDGEGRLGMARLPSLLAAGQAMPEESAAPARSAGADGLRAPSKGAQRGAGYRELAADLVETARAATDADAAWLLRPGADGRLRVRAASGYGRGAAPWPGASGLAPAGPGMPDLAPAICAREAYSLITVPLAVGGRVTGVLAVAAQEADRFGEQDAARMQVLAGRCAAALETCRLDLAEPAARVGAVQERAAFLAEVGDMLAANLDPEQIVTAGAQLAATHLADWCAVLLTDAGRPPRLAHCSHSDPALVAALAWLLERSAPPAVADPVLPDPAGVAGPAQRWRLAEPTAEALPHRGPGTAPAGTSRLGGAPAWCFPLAAADRMLGVLAIAGPPEGASLPRDVAELADGLARRIGLALEHARRDGRQPLTPAGRANGWW